MQPFPWSPYPKGLWSKWPGGPVAIKSVLDLFHFHAKHTFINCLAAICHTGSDRYIIEWTEKSFSYTTSSMVHIWYVGCWLKLSVWPFTDKKYPTECIIEMHGSHRGTWPHSTPYIRALQHWRHFIVSRLCAWVAWRYVEVNYFTLPFLSFNKNWFALIPCAYGQMRILICIVRGTPPESSSGSNEKSGFLEIFKTNWQVRGTFYFK